MEKYSYEVYCTEKASEDAKSEYIMLNVTKNLKFTDLSSKAMLDGETHFRSDDITIIASPIKTSNVRLGPNGATMIAITSHNPAEIIPRLIKAYKRRVKCGLSALSFFTIILAMSAGVCFPFINEEGRTTSNKIEILICAIIAGVSSLISMVFICLMCHTLLYGYVWMNDALRIIQIDGETWHCQTESLEETIPKTIIDTCDCTIYSRFRRRPHGHIVLAKEGIVVDNIIALRYDTYIVSSVDLINNAMDRRWIIRVVLVASDLLDCERDKNGYTLFNLDLYMSSYIRAEDVIDMRDIILSNSLKYLLTSTYYAKSQINCNNSF